MNKGLQHIHPGAALLAATLVTAAIALNRGIDLLWGMALLLACALLAGLLLPWAQLRGIELRRRWPAEAVAGQPCVLEYEITLAGRFPRYGITVCDALGEDAALVAAVYLPRLAGHQHSRLRWCPPVRGLRRVAEVQLECSFPLGLWTARRRLSLPPQELLVYPDAVALRALPPPGGDDAALLLAPSRLRGGVEEFYALQGYRPGDPLRAIDWRRSARGGELLSRQFEQPLDQRLWIVVELCAGAHLGHGAQGSAELMFRAAHSVALRALREPLAVGLLGHAHGQWHTLQPVTDDHGYRQLREQLARLPLDATAPTLPQLLTRPDSSLPRGGAWLLFNPGGAATRAALAQGCRAQGAAPLLLEFALDEDAAGSGAPRRVAGSPPTWLLSSGAALEDLFAC